MRGFKVKDELILVCHTPAAVSDGIGISNAFDMVCCVANLKAFDNLEYWITFRVVYSLS